MKETNTVEVTQTTSQMTPIIRYQLSKELPPVEMKVKNIRKRAANCTMMFEKFTRWEKPSLMMRYLEENETALVLT